MDMLSRIDAHTRVAAVSRSDEAHGEVSREFAALIVGEEAARRRHRSSTGDDSGAGFAAPPRDPPHEPAESIIESESVADAGDLLPEDAHDPQELRAMLAARP
ncbi:hypothetical protein GJ654_03835 [Rhodoblastus acidophilus]|uniref:Uncharacterized protein n=1 Tax=Rhodoblastus acidophilus TaxID=1074 RepID=A0A6N8DLR9_RHOAC|nr:hypothetical protein [Rhodoblastus acidophilus]MCW2273225.1 hypothetical protein [Rhodoblastus acidophilus]MTV30121.1 hypothetical protein [Rhodoblastus acidophilus]